MIQTNSMFGDPLLMGNRVYDNANNDIQRIQQELEAKKQLLDQTKTQVIQQQQVATQQSQTPVWDEINAIMESLGEQEFNYMTNNEEFVASQNEITNILQNEYLRLMRPLVEQSKAGKDALDRHLTLVKRLKKSASKVVEDELALFSEYRKNYAHISFDEYMRMKRENSYENK